MKKIFSILASCLVLASSANSATVQGAAAVPVQGTPVSLTWSVEGQNSLNPDKVQKIIVKLVDASGNPAAAAYSLSGFDARMPEHNHGMVTKPVIQKISPAEYAVDGVKLHMAGKWILEFKVADNKVPDKSVKVPVEIN